MEQDWELPQGKHAVCEVRVDGGKVRLGGKPQPGWYWRYYKTLRLQGIYDGAFFDKNQSLVDYVNSQSLVNPLVCLGDGHDGVWNLVKEFGTEKFKPLEVLDWYHLKENFYQIGGSLKRLQAVGSLLWQGHIELIQALLNNCRSFSTIIKYTYYQAEQMCSIGSGSVESAI